MTSTEKVKELKEVHTIQGEDGNWNTSSYMTGMYNGLELALAIIEDREPAYRDIVWK